MTSHVLIRRATGAVLTVLMVVGLGVSVAPPAARADVITWTLRDSVESDWKAVGFGKDGSGNDLWVAVAQSRTDSSAGATVTDSVMTSPDGITWSSSGVTYVGDPGHIWNSVAYGGGRWVATAAWVGRSTGNVMTSTDGAEWVIGAGLDGSDFRWNSVAFGEDGSGNGRWIAVGSVGSGCGPAAATSTDGITWTVNDFSAGSSGSCPRGDFAAITALRAVAHAGGGQWVATGIGGGLRSADGGNTWTATDLGAGLWDTVVHADDRWVALLSANSGAKAMTSEAGVTWVEADTFQNGQWRQVAYGSDGSGSGLLVAVAAFANQRVTTSSDGVVWEGQWGVPSQIWEGLAYGNGLWVAVSSNGTQRVMTGVPVGGSTGSNGSNGPNGGTVQGDPAVDLPVAAAVAAAQEADVAGSSSAVLVRRGQVAPVTSGSVAGVGPRGGVRLEAEGLTVSVAAVGGASPRTGVVTPVGGEIVCEVCAALVAGSTVEAWLYSTPQLVAAVQVPDDHEDGDCVLLRIPTAAPLTGEAIAAGAHTLQLRLQAADGLEVLATGVTVGTAVPTAVPAGGGPVYRGLLGLLGLLGAVVLFAGALARPVRGAARRAAGSVA